MNHLLIQTIVTGCFAILILGIVGSMMDWDEVLNKGTSTRKQEFCEEQGMIMNVCKVSDPYYCCFYEGDKLTEYPLVYDYETKEVSFGKIGIKGGS